MRTMETEFFSKIFEIQFLPAMPNTGFQLIKPRVAYGIQNSGRSSEHDFIFIEGWRSEKREWVPFICGFSILLDAYDDFGTQQIEETSQLYCNQTEIWLNGAQNMILRASIWLETIRNKRWTKLKEMRRWCWRRRPPDGRGRPGDEMGGHPFKHRWKKQFENCLSKVE